jgi:site-specific DNA-methyltransferase (adenine-specific)
MNKIINNDCIKAMKDIEDNSIDMVLCDLPYGTTQNKWDIVIPLEPLWEQYKRVCKENAAILLFSQTPFDKVLGCSNLEMLRYEWIWIKSKATGHYNCRKMPLKKHENILVFYKKLPTYNPQMAIGKPYINNTKPFIQGSNYGVNKKYNFYVNKGTRFPNSILIFDSINTNKQLHPTQKPLALCEYFIKTYTDEQEVILDNCIGSGTTAIAAINTNRKYIGIEKDKKYYDMAVQRIKERNEELEDMFSTHI